MTSNQEATFAKHLGDQRPGAMTAVMLAAAPMNHGPRELRVGRVEGGAIVDDRQYRATLTYGDSERAGLLIPGSGVHAAPLFERSATGAFTLLVPEGARGRLSLSAGVVDLAQVVGTSLPLDASARGKLVLGGTTLLFQLVPPASVALRPRLTTAARGGILAMIDWRFTSYVMASLCAHLVFVAWLDSADFAIDASPSMIPDQFAQLIIDIPNPPSIPDEPRTDDPQPVADPVASNVEPSDTPAHPSRTTPDHATPSRAPASPVDGARIAAEAADRAGQILVGALGDSSTGALADLMHTGTTSEAQALLDSVRGVGIATGPAGVLRSRAGGHDGSGETGPLGDLRLAGHGATEQQPEGVIVREVRIVYTVSEPDAPIQQSGDRDPDDVVRVLRARRQAFQACYEQRTRVNPELQGKISAVFTVSEMGTVSGVRITENHTDDAPLATCIASTFQRLRFGEVSGSGDSTFAHAFVFAPQH